MAEKKWIGLDKYYNNLGEEVYGDSWDSNYIELLSGAKRNTQSEKYKKAVNIRQLFRERIWNDIEAIQAKPRKEQPYIAFEMHTLTALL